MRRRRKLKNSGVRAKLIFIGDKYFKHYILLNVSFSDIVTFVEYIISYYFVISKHFFLTLSPLTLFSVTNL